MNEEKTIGELLKKYPEGFAVGPAGMISRTLLASSHFVAIARAYPVAPTDGGYMVVEMTKEGEGGNADSDYAETPHPSAYYERTER